VLAARRLLDRKHRLTAGATLVEGPHALEVVLAAGRSVREVFVTGRFARSEPQLLAAVAGTGAAVRTVTEPVLERLADTRTPQGVVAVADIPSQSVDAVLSPPPRLAILLVECADPGNLGTVARTADAAGAGALLVSAGSADPWAGKAIRASAGSLFALPVADRCDPTDAAARLHAAGLTVLVTAADGESDLDDLIDRGELRAPTAWVFGNEARGVPPEVAGAADHRVRIPMAGAAESLNLAAAAAICLFATARAQRPHLAHRDGPPAGTSVARTGVEGGESGGMRRLGSRGQRNTS
jgi:TrmH family RNA methyltransferase